VFEAAKESLEKKKAQMLVQHRAARIRQRLALNTATGAPVEGSAVVALQRGEASAGSGAIAAGASAKARATAEPSVDATLAAEAPSKGEGKVDVLPERVGVGKGGVAGDKLRGGSENTEAASTLHVDSEPSTARDIEGKDASESTSEKLVGLRATDAEEKAVDTLEKAGNIRGLVKETATSAIALQTEVARRMERLNWLDSEIANLGSRVCVLKAVLSSFLFFGSSAHPFAWQGSHVLQHSETLFVAAALDFNSTCSLQIRQLSLFVLKGLHHHRTHMLFALNLTTLCVTCTFLQLRFFVFAFTLSVNPLVSVKVAHVHFVYRKGKSGKSSRSRWESCGPACERGWTATRRRRG
jgi:hypothetical protein